MKNITPVQSSQFNGNLFTYIALMYMELLFNYHINILLKKNVQFNPLKWLFGSSNVNV